MENISKNYARTFSTPSGRAVLAHLRKITIERVLGPNATESQLRSLESQRALVHQIENLTKMEP
ncbi:MAG: hypothetical protein IKA73_00035 [Alphaproteobacteria bacterium]|nr:hypothetical protein [Alphaproteobacteria bacterium]MBR2341844.1 hypothetical protein [Alphaproteobacteria bacterium]MBR2482342.1 hypothetical protein [Alphaproteobacteria bacterium]